MVFPRFYIFDSNSVLLTIIFSIISSTMAIEFSRLEKKQEGRQKSSLFLFSIFLGLSFSLTHLFMVVSAGIPFADINYYLYFFLFFIFCTGGSFIVLFLAQKNSAGTGGFILISLLIGTSTVIAVYVGFSMIFKESASLRPGLFLLSGLLVLWAAFSWLRFLIQITNEDLYEFVKRWKYVGCLLGGFSLAGIPYILLASVIEPPAGYDGDGLVTPFIFTALFNLLFMLVPDLFGDKLLMKQVQSHLSLFNHNPDSIFRLNLKGEILNANKEAVFLTGYSNDELVGLHFHQLIHEEEEGKLKSFFRGVVSGVAKNIETKLSRPDGKEIEVRITAARIIVNGDTAGVFGIIRDITEQKQAASTIEYFAYHDELTNLANRRQMENVMGRYHTEQKPFSILYLDFDRFKRINDTFGHSFGDEILASISRKLAGFIPAETLLARLGGDEFALIVPNQQNIEQLAENILSAFQKPITIQGIELLITASMGIAHFPGDSSNPDEVLKFADLAMYKAKQNGSNTYCFFDRGLADQSLYKFELENDLRNSVQNGGLMVYYQPKYDVEKRRIIGAEALARWNRKGQGAVPPDVFIPVAEEANLIVPLERVIIEKVFGDIAAWKRRGLETMRTSINISTIHFYQDDFFKYMKDSLKRHSLKGEFIEIEVTESIMIKNERLINEQLQALRKIGVEVSIDDFGTGYSSLSYLSKMSVDRLKIDRSFIEKSHENSEIISTIISMANNLKLKVIAEGVETEGQIELLKAFGCNEMQGYYYSPPIPAKEFEKILENEEAVFA
ncbi:EAL domain-containing protein [Mesobacillus zeae]|uniref:EAL domain-containing protein n=1 Tax=Mesobacillus zeae TaxID=1917180 RepID=A0A398B430_9BACI|nr:EAL domain-containing protein [Mesobacillus zeae]RID84665.1 EAL domain-containing protein [Mesobacillus zeae]